MSAGVAAPRRRRTIVAAAVLAAALVAGGVAITVIAARGPTAPDTLQQRVRAVAAGLRCPVCQDLSVADSPSPLARAMRARIAAELTAGTSPGAIRDGFVRAYGTWILMAPPKRGLSLVVWLLPLLLAVAGCAIAAVAVRRWTRDRPGGPPPAAVDGAAGAADRASRDLTASDRRLLDRALTRAAGTEEPG